MASAAELAIVLKAKDEASRAMQGLTDKTGGLNRAFQTLKRVGAVAAVAAIAAVGAAITKGVLSAMDFEKGMAEVHTLLGKDFPTKSWDALNKDVLGLSKEMGIATSEMIPALYQAISAGIPPENVIAFLREGAKASIGGVTDLETAVDGLTTVVNAFGLSADDTGRVADIMFTGVKLGKTTMEELSASMFQAAPIAASLGLTIEEVVAATATLTKSGTPTSVAMTQVRQAMVALSKPTADMSKLLAETGYESGEALLKAKGFTGALELLTDAAGGNKEVLGKAFGSVEALQSVLGLTGENAAIAAADLAAVTDSAGAADEAFGIMNETTARQWDIFKNKLNVALIQLGQKILPVVLKAIDGVSKAVSKLIPAISTFIKGFTAGFKEADVTSKGFFGTAERIGKAVRELVDIFRATFLPVIEAVVGALRKLASDKELIIAALAGIGALVVAVVVPAFIAWAAATIAATWPILAIIVAAAALGVAIMLLIKHWDEIKAAVTGFIDKVREIPVVGKIFDAVVQVVKDKINAVIGILQGLIDFGKELIHFFSAVFSGDWAAAWDSLKEMAKIALNLFLDFLQLTFLGTLKSIFTGLGLWDWAKGAFETFKTEASNFLSGVADTVRGVGADIAKAIGDGLRSALGWARGAMNALITIIERGVNYVIGLINAIPDVNLPFGLGSIGIPDIPRVSVPRLQAGTSFFRGGAAILGEGGPEMAILPRGSRVLNAQQTAQGVGRPIELHFHFEGIFTASEFQMEQLVRQALPEMRRQIEGALA